MSHVNDAGEALPEPPFAPELIADYHAGVLTDDLSTHIRSRLSEDPDAEELLAQLDATVDQLGSLRSQAPVVGERVRAASEATLARLEATPPSVPTRRWTRPRTALVSVAAAAAVLLCGVIVAEVVRPARPSSPDTATPLPASDAASLLAAVRSGPTEELDANRLARCLTANKLGGSGVVGAGYLVYQGRPAQVILTPTGRPGRFNALVTTRDCDAGKPGTLARAVVSE